MGNLRNIAFWVVLFVLILTLFNLFSGGGSTLQSQSTPYSDFVQLVEEDKVSSAVIDGETIRYRGKDGRDYVTIKPEDAEVTQVLIDNGVAVNAESQEQSGFQSFILSLLPFLLLIGVWIYFMNRMQGGGKGGAMGFGKSKAKMLTEKHGRVTEGSAPPLSIPGNNLTIPPDLMSKLANLSTPVMCTTTGFHRHDARRQSLKEPQHLRAPQLLP